MATKLSFGQKAKTAPAPAPATTTAAAPATAAKKTPARTTAAKPDTVTDVQATVVDTPASAAKATGLTKAPAPETTTALAHPASPAVEGFDGELDSSDIRLPRLNIVNGNSKLHTEDDYPIGAFVVEKELQIGSKEDVLTVVCLNIAKSYQQKLPYGESDEMPLRFRTKEEVEANGGTTKYSDEAVKAQEFYAARADMVLAILAPEGLDESELHRFPEELGGSRWGRFIFTVTGGGYQSMAVPIITAALGKLKTRGGLAAGVFTVKSEKRSGKGNTWVVPAAKFAELVDDPEQLEFFTNLVAESVPVHDEE